ncbi:MAG: GGDEF domain-containing protein [Thermogutta sp.]|nr:GGDEF domain-containing protein [Thermogutta sp.]
MPAAFYYVLIGILLGAVQLAVGIVLGRLLGRYLGADSRSCGPSSQGRRAVLRQIRGITRRIESDVADYRRFLESASQGFLRLPQTDALDEAVLDAVRRLVAANQMLQERLAGAEAQLAEQAKRIEEQWNQANSDPLTGLANRRAFDGEFSRQFASWRRTRQPFSVVLLDLDHFKQINDRFGHPVGDEALVRVGRILQGTVRETDFPARIGGEEFAVLCPHSDPEAAARTAERIRRAVARVTIGKGAEWVRVSVSCGLACVAENEPPEALIRRADEALYAAKDSGRNCSYMHDGREPVPVAERDLDDPPDAPRPANEPRSGGLERDAEYQVLADSLRSALARLS